MSTFRPKTIENLQFFVGKVCTVITSPINRTFDELRSREHFVVKVEEITIDGVWGVHPYRGTVSFFPIDHVILIQEEQVLDPNNEEHRQMIEDYEKQTGKKIMSDVSPNLAPTVKKETDPLPEPVSEFPFIDVDQLASLAKDTKRSYALHDMTKKKLMRPD